MDKSLMDKMDDGYQEKHAGDSSESRIMELWDELDETQRQEILNRMEEMCGYTEEGEGAPETSSGPEKSGMEIVISKK